jgi:hypothetical protein
MKDCLTEYQVFLHNLEEHLLFNHVYVQVDNEGEQEIVNHH